MYYCPEHCYDWIQNILISNVLKKIFFSIFNWRLITLQYFGGFCHTVTSISHGCTCVPHPEPPPTSLPIPSLWVVPVHQLWVPCFMQQTDCSSISQMLIHMFQCYSLKSSRPHLLPQSPKVCFLYLSPLLSCVQGCRYHLSKFHIYVPIYCTAVFLSDLLHSV